MKATRHFSLLSILGIATVCAGTPQHLKGQQLQFSHCPSYKFTPLLIRFGQSTGGNTYAITSENGLKYQVQYTPDKTKNTAILRVQGPNNVATINMRFETDVFGTATMKWNGIPYYHLTFRLTENKSTISDLARMGDSVGDIVPFSIGENVLEVCFDGAFEQVFSDEGKVTAKSPVRLTPLVIRFPEGKNSFTGKLSDGREASVEFERIGCGARIGISGHQLNSEVMLDFADSNSGTATLEKFTNDSTHLIRGATFRLLPSTEADGDLTLPRESNTSALHNACGLSHVKIAQWPIGHGADTQAHTAKGGGAADGIGGKQAAAVKTLLQKAK